MAREFKPIRFFVLMALAAFIVCGVTAFYTQRAAHGRSPAERTGYAVGLKTGEAAPKSAKLLTAADLNTLAQKRFKEVGSGNQSDWDLGFAKGNEQAFKKTHPQ